MPFVSKLQFTKFLRKAAAPLGILLAIFFGVALLPGKVEGVYDQDWSTCGCDDVDEYAEFLDGRMNQHFYNARHDIGPSWYTGNYVTDANGTVEVRFRPQTMGEEGKLIFKAYPHFLVTRFVTVGDNHSRWKWKLPVLPDLRRWLEKSRMIEVVHDSSGSHKRIYDHDGQVIDDIFTPRKLKL